MIFQVLAVLTFLIMLGVTGMTVFLLVARAKDRKAAKKECKTGLATINNNVHILQAETARVAALAAQLQGQTQDMRCGMDEIGEAVEAHLHEMPATTVAVGSQGALSTEPPTDEAPAPPPGVEPFIDYAAFSNDTAAARKQAVVRPTQAAPSLADKSWMHVNDNKRKGYMKGGIAAANIWARDNVLLNQGACVETGHGVAGKALGAGKVCYTPQALEITGAGMEGERGLVRVKGDLEVRDAVQVGVPATGPPAWGGRSTLNVAMTPGRVGASFAGTQHWSHFPWLDNTVYIRPGADGAGIRIGDEGNPSHVHVHRSRLPDTDGHAYLRASTPGHKVHVGEDASAIGGVEIASAEAATNVRGTLAVHKDAALVQGRLLFGGLNNSSNAAAIPFASLQRIKPADAKEAESVRFTLTDSNVASALEVWGGACGTSAGCSGPGLRAHALQADGTATHTGSLAAKDVTLDGRWRVAPTTSPADGKTRLGLTDKSSGAFADLRVGHAVAQSVTSSSSVTVRDATPMVAAMRSVDDIVVLGTDGATRGVLSLGPHDVGIYTSIESRTTPSLLVKGDGTGVQINGPLRVCDTSGGNCRRVLLGDA